jgi:hypothetical protein
LHPDREILFAAHTDPQASEEHLYRGGKQDGSNENEYGLND